MKYKKYPSYKDSGVEWLGEIPEHWNIKRLKNVIRASITDGPHETPEFTDKGIPFLSVDGIQEGELTFDKCRYVSEKAHIQYKKKANIERDDILLGKAASIGKVARVKVDFEFSIWSPLALIKPDKNEVSSNYLEYLLKSSLTQYQIQQLSTSNTQQNISMADIPKFIFSLPIIKEQQQIAKFLDNATQKMDTLIQKQENLIKLLKEKRQAVISHAVTRGLNPDVKFKDSGVEWLGKVPEHWGKSKLGYETKVKARLGWKGLKAEEYVESGYIFLATPNIKNNKIDFINVNYITKERYKESPEIMLREGDVLVTKDGSTTGTTNVIRNLPEPSTVNSSIAVIRPNKNLDSIFLYYYFLSTYIQETINLLRGGMGVPHLFQADLRFFILLLPSLREQQEISTHLDDKTKKIDTLIKKATKSIKLLKEKRTALISAAVTGKIDVRELV